MRKTYKYFIQNNHYKTFLTDYYDTDLNWYHYSCELQEAHKFETKEEAAAVLAKIKNKDLFKIIRRYV